MLLNGAANRDPAPLRVPARVPHRPAQRPAHIAFGRGAHSCPGGPLARAEGRVSLERILDRMRDIRLSEEHHGPPGARRFDYEPTWILRGLTSCTSSSPGRGRVVSRVAVVTGGASGIGLGVAQQLAADGHAVALLDRERRGRGGAAAELRRAAARRMAVEVDVADRASVDAAFAEVRAELGPIGILVTSAGIESFTRWSTSPRRSWDRIIAVNLTGTFACIQAAVPDMLAAGWGRIVTISSSSAQSGAPNMSHYAASKGGVIGLTRALAGELAGQRHHRQHDLAEPRRHPDGAERPRRPATSSASTWSRRWCPSAGRARPADIAAACSFLCSEGGELHHRPGHRRQRRHVHLSPGGLANTP